jgi:acyl-CoA thioester hydrolase
MTTGSAAATRGRPGPIPSASPGRPPPLVEGRARASVLDRFVQERGDIVPEIARELGRGQPLVVHREAVKPEWIDYNGHMNVAYYMLGFDRAADALFDFLGFDAAFRARTGFSSFALECHVVYKREVGLGDALRFEIQMLDFDGRFFHYMNRMYNDRENYLAATCEWISGAIDLETRRMMAMPSEIAAPFQALHDAHRDLPRPPEAGRVIGIRRKAAAGPAA